MKYRGVFAIAVLSAVALGMSQTIDPFYADDYSFADLGSIQGVPINYGGLTLKWDDPNTLLIGGNANTTVGAVYAVGLIRDGDGHIIGFDGPATFFASAPFIDGGLAYGPGNVLFATGYSNNTLMQIKPGSTAPDRTDTLTSLGVGASVGTVAFVPTGFNGAGRMKVASYTTGGFYDVTFTEDGSGTYDLTGATLASTPGGGPEGIAYVPLGSTLFDNQSMLISEYSLSRISSYEIDADGNPVVSSRRTFMTGLSGAEGAFIDPVTGDFMFSTFGGGNRVVVVSGFEAVPEPATMAVLALGSLALLRRRKRA